MARKSSESSEAERSAVRRLASRQAAGDDSHVQFEDAPRLTKKQLEQMTRLRDLPQRKVPVSVRLDPAVVEWLKSKGRRHLTRINDILTYLMESERSPTSGRGR